MSLIIYILGSKSNSNYHSNHLGYPTNNGQSSGSRFFSVLLFIIGLIVLVLILGLFPWEKRKNIKLSKYAQNRKSSSGKSLGPEPDEPDSEPESELDLKLELKKDTNYRKLYILEFYVSNAYEQAKARVNEFIHGNFKPDVFSDGQYYVVGISFNNYELARIVKERYQIKSQIYQLELKE